MAENLSSDEIFRRVLSNQRALMEQTPKILAQQNAVKKQVLHSRKSLTYC